MRKKKPNCIVVRKDRTTLDNKLYELILHDATLLRYLVALGVDKLPMYEEARRCYKRDMEEECV